MLFPSLRVLSAAAIWIFPILIPAHLRADDLYVLSIQGEITKVTSTGVASHYASLGGVSDRLAIDSKGNLFATVAHSDPARHRVVDLVQIAPNGAVSLFVPGVGAQALAVNSRDELLVINEKTLFKVTSAGSLNQIATGSGFDYGMAFDGRGDLFVAGFHDGSIAKILLSGGDISPATSGFIPGRVNFPTLTQVVSAWMKSIAGQDLKHPTSLAFGPDGNLYVGSDNAQGGQAPGSTIFKVTQDGTISKLAKGGIESAILAFDSQGTLYMADSATGIIYKVSDQGALTVFVSGLQAPVGLVFSPGLKLSPVTQTSTATNVTRVGTALALMVGLVLALRLFFKLRGVRTYRHSGRV